MILKKKKNTLTTPIPRAIDLHKKFIQICRKNNLNPENGDYPFNTKDFGRRSFYRYIKKIKERNSSLLVSEYGEDAVKYFKSTGSGEQNTIIDRPFERVEFDGHRIDAAIALKYTTLEGDVVVQNLNRIWLLTIIDVATKTILGYYVSYNKEYTAVDVMYCIYNSIIPHQQKEITIVGLQMPSIGGFHSNVILESRFAVWDELCFDNAKANLANMVKQRLKTIVGCNVNTGPVATPTRRPIIEKFFHILEENGFHRLVSTTGSNPKDPRRQNAEEKAVKYEITPDEIEQLIEYLIAERNGTEQKGLSYLSPLEAM